jgi:hypothetical protein
LVGSPSQTISLGEYISERPRAVKTNLRKSTEVKLATTRFVGHDIKDIPLTSSDSSLPSILSPPHGNSFEHFWKKLAAVMQDFQFPQPIKNFCSN